MRAEGRSPELPEAPWQRESDGSWRLGITGSYRTGNGRSLSVGPRIAPTPEMPQPDPEKLPLPTPTTPTTDGEELTSIDPPWLAALTSERSAVTSVEYRRRGRTVHWASFQVLEQCWETVPDWHHRCADDWDNCLDPEFLRFTGATELLADEAVYERDRWDWETDTWYHAR